MLMLHRFIDVWIILYQHILPCMLIFFLFAAVIFDIEIMFKKAKHSDSDPCMF